MPDTQGLPLPPPPEPGPSAAPAAKTTIFGREPALIAGLIAAGIALAVSLGLHLTGEQVGAITVLVNAVVAVAVRQTSTATPKVDGLIQTAISMPANATVADVRQAHADEETAHKGEAK